MTTLEQDTMSSQSEAPDVSKSEPVYTDYFGFQATERHYLPDGRQYIEFDVMNEGAKSRFQKMTSRDLRVQRSTGEALLKMDPGAERHALITESVVGWNLMRKSPKTGQWEPAPFDSSNLRRFIENTDPRIVEDLEKAIRKANPWLMDEMSVEDIDKEIANLQEMRQAAVEREQGKSASAA